MSDRTFTITAERGAKTVMKVEYDNPGDALRSFSAALEGAGHSQRRAQSSLQAWTRHLMSGSDGFTVLDPDLSGSVSINIKP